MVAELDDISSSSKNNDVFTAVPASLIIVSTLSFMSSMCCCTGDIRTTEPEACDKPEVAAEPVKYLLFMLSNVSVFVPALMLVTNTTSLLVALSGLTIK